MKKLLTFFLLFYSIIGFAFETNANFGIKQQSSTEGYRQYIGKQFFSVKLMDNWKHGIKVGLSIKIHMQEKYLLLPRFLQKM